jgi:hypothetical protein
MNKSDIHSIALSEEQVTGDHVHTKFIPMSYLKANIKKSLWQKNKKRHNIGDIYQSIERYGFLDFPKWDRNLNGGKGGFVLGNGRAKTLISLLVELMEQGAEPPRGIPVNTETGEWCIPINFGLDAKSEAEAMAFAIDHNNLTMSGGDFSAHDFARMWDGDYVDLLQELANSNVLPVSVDAEDLAAMIANLNPSFGASDDNQGDLDHTKPKEINCICPSCDYEFIKQM